jgi:hypothetical protein
MHPSLILEDGAGGGDGGAATQMLRSLQICPKAQSALVLQPTLGGAVDEAGAGGGAATQILCTPQTCPAEQSASVSQPTLGGAVEEAAGGGAGGAATQML